MINTKPRETAILWYNPIPLLAFRGFEPGPFKMIKISMKKFKILRKIRTSFLQSRCPGCCPWAIRTIHKFMKHNLLLRDICYCFTGLACLYQFVCYTVLGGRHFPPKSNDDCLPCFLSPSFFYEYCLVLSCLVKEQLWYTVCIV